MVAGASRSSRGMMYTRDQPWGVSRGVSSFGNNYRTVNAAGVPTSGFLAVPGFACDSGGFYKSGTLCAYGLQLGGLPTKPQITNSAFLCQRHYQIADGWEGYLNTWVSRVESFGRYAPVPATVTIAADSPNNPTGGTSVVQLRHRFAAAGNRDTFTDNNVYDVLMGVSW